MDALDVEERGRVDEGRVEVQMCLIGREKEIECEEDEGMREEGKEDEGLWVGMSRRRGEVEGWMDEGREWVDVLTWYVHYRIDGCGWGVALLLNTS